MSIMGFIQQQKEKFRSVQTSNKVEALQRQQAQLKKERERQGVIAQEEAKTRRLQEDVNRIKEYNQKEEMQKREQRVNTIKNFGKGVARTINAGRRELKGVGFGSQGVKSSGKRLRSLQQSNQGSTGLQYGGTRNIDVGGNSGSAFNVGKRNLDVGGKSKKKLF